MRATVPTYLTLIIISALAATPRRQQPTANFDAASDSINVMVGRLDLDRYKATIQALTLLAIAAKARIGIERPSIGLRRVSEATDASRSD
jgi:hypothetical protein